MAFGRRKNETSGTPTGKLPKTMPTRFQPDDARSAGHETTYQSSRGGWLKPRK
ncbi:hypothetical protein [Streptomyces xantholiticus]|uniref:hypothetical protein n=1 Tax=Streptomyces xantholiticus TaxID=68285 RepID=UPI001675C795|nr:hypothetical protein [Streptomyces xantholiticus]GGW41244.1 hypothetical protein GCM10010381_27620 [Streptomyces xantholiticus]